MSQHQTYSHCVTERLPTIDELIEPLREIEAKDLILKILKVGVVNFRTHARDRMDERALSSPDVLNVLRAGYVKPSEYENGTWRYQVCTERMTVVVAFRSKTELRIVTAWRHD